MLAHLELIFELDVPCLELAEDDGQAKLIYDRVNPGDEAAGSQLAAQENDPISDVPAQAEESSNPISRVGNRLIIASTRPGRKPSTGIACSTSSTGIMTFSAR